MNIEKESHHKMALFFSVSKKSILTFLFTLQKRRKVLLCRLFCDIILYSRRALPPRAPLLLCFRTRIHSFLTVSESHHKMALFLYVDNNTLYMRTCREKSFWKGLSDIRFFFKVVDPVGDAAGKVHVVGDAQYAHAPFLRLGEHNGPYL